MAGRRQPIHYPKVGVCLRAGVLQEDYFMPEGLHELPDKELRQKLASGELSDKKANIASATLRRRRLERVQAWLGRHAWLGAILAAIGLAGIFSIGRRE